MIAFRALLTVPATSTPDATDPLQPAWFALRSFYAGLGWSVNECLMPVPAASWKERDVAQLAAQSIPLLRHGEGQSEAVEALSRLALELDRRGAAADVLRSVLPSWVLVRNPDACLCFARALCREGTDGEAIAMMRQAIAIDPAHGAGRRALGLGLRRLGQIDEAGMHLEIATALRRRGWFHIVSELEVPVLVAQTGLEVEIYVYGRAFYVYPRRQGSIGVRAIAGELFEIRKTASYKFVRTLMLVRRVHSFFRWLANRRFVRPYGQSASARAPGLMRRLGDGARILARRFVRFLALRLFARPIDRRASTFEAAMDLAAGCVPDGAHGG